MNDVLDKLFSKPVISKLIEIYFFSVKLLEIYGLPILLLFIRIWMAKIFWYSGLTKISNWPATLFLFKEEYKVPFIPYEIAAYISTFFELGCPILLIVGFATRFATLPMIAMTVVIELTYTHSVEHYYWGMLFILILLHGPGRLSLDYYIANKARKSLHV